jgi:hypothetical protein
MTDEKLNGRYTRINDINGGNQGNVILVNDDQNDEMYL